MKSFDKIVGQEKAKSRLAFYLNAYAKGGIVPSTLLIAPKGCGKTEISECIGLELFELSGKVKACKLVNCSTVKNLRQFFNQILIPCLVDKEATIILDEASEIPRDVNYFLLSMLAPKEGNKNLVTKDDYTIEVDFRKHNFILATTEAHKVDSALRDRCVRIELEEYTQDHIATIIQKRTQKVDPSALLDIASVCRGNARQAVLLVNEIERYQQGVSGAKFGVKQWRELKEILGLNPLGLSNIELQVLNVLKDRPEGTSLTRIAAVIGMNRDVIQRDIELYPQKLGLIEIGTGGRTITAKGLKYLKEINA